MGSETVVGLVHPWVGLDWVGLSWVTNLQILYGLGWVMFEVMSHFCDHAGTAEMGE